MIKPSFYKVADEITDRNFQELTKLYSQLFIGAFAKPPVSVALVTGDNALVPSVAVPQGRIVTYQDAAASLFDKGMINGKWVINSSAPCNVRITWF